MVTRTTYLVSQKKKSLKDCIPLKLIALSNGKQQLVKSFPIANPKPVRLILSRKFRTTICLTFVIINSYH